jgi:hypothetical protein
MFHAPSCRAGWSAEIDVYVLQLDSVMKIHLQRTNIKGLLSRVPLYPFLLAVYPVLSLLAINIREIFARDALLPILIALLFTLVVLGVIRIVSRSWQLAGYLTGLLVVWIFVYGHLYNLIKNFSIMGIIVGRHRYLIVVWSGIIIGIALLLIRKRRHLPSINLPLNLICAILVFVPIVQISVFKLGNLFYSQKATETSGTPLISWTKNTSPPDIYYIILDGYGRADAIQELYGIDNSAFIGSLRQLGFYIAACSQSNYTRTILSVTSTFNMEYIQSLNTHTSPDQDTSWLYPYLKHSLVRQQLEQLGYQTIVFTNPWENMVWEDANIVYQPAGSGYLSPFEYLLLNTTVMRIYLDSEQALLSQRAYYTNYVDTLYALDKLQEVPAISGPKFIFAHLVIPHSPFVFSLDGEYVYIQPYDTVNNLYSDADFKLGYTSAITYINKRMLEIIPRLINASETPPIIIIAGDHGVGDSTTVTMNLEAFYVTDATTTFYATLTPVNIFRVLFDDYFNGNFGLLPDKSYFSAGGKYFNFQEIPNNCSQP